MKDYIHDETKYIKRQDLKEFLDAMNECDFAPDEIENEHKFHLVFEYLINLTEKAPYFLQSYEYALAMTEVIEPTKELEELQAFLFQKWVEACQFIAAKDEIFGKKIEWGWMENRPLIRGLCHEANSLWMQGEIKEANKLFKNLYKANPSDNLGIRYSIKATDKGMSIDEFHSRFLQTDELSNGYKEKELLKWFGKE